MKRLLSAIFGASLCITGVLCAQQPAGGAANIAGTLYASNFAKWTAASGTNGPFSWSSPQVCTAANVGGVTFQPFKVGTPIQIVDTATPANSEIVTPSAVNINGSGCSLTATTTKSHYSFYLGSATAGLQEAINYANGQPYVVVITSDFTRLGGTTDMIVNAKGNSAVSILDERSSVIVPYIWSPGSSTYVAQPFGGAAPTGPQYRISGFTGAGSGSSFNLGQTNAYTDATGNPLTVPGFLSGKITNGALNADFYGGVANALASSDCPSGCDVQVPQTSTSTEEVSTKTNSQVDDFRNGSESNFFQNPPSKVFNLFGAAYSGAKTIYALWDQATPTSGNYPSQNQDGLHMVNNFNAQGWYYGTWGGPYLGSDWSAVHGISITQNASSLSIVNMITGTQTKTSNGDSALMYLLGTNDGGDSHGGDEGATGIGIHDDQSSTWFHGTVAAGATTGTQLLPVTYTPGTNSRPQVSVGGIMLNLHAPPLTGFVTGPAVAIPNYAAWATPVDATTPISSAWGRANAAIPEPITHLNAQSDTVNFTVDGGTNAGGFAVGTACLDGAALYEQVKITAVSALSGGAQDVTFTHRFPNVQSGTSLWQGGLCGTYYFSEEVYMSRFNDTLTNWRTDYPVFGARSNHEIVGRFLTASSGTLATAAPIPNFWNASTANVALKNLTVSGTTVTASFASTNSSNTLNGLASAVISNASNAAFNGTVSNVVLSNNYQTISWTQTGVSGTSATANISYPSVYFNFYLFQGAAVTQPATSAGVPLEPNSVPWAVGNQLENPFDPAFGGYALSSSQSVNSPDSNAITNIGARNILAIGVGVSGQYKFWSAGNRNPSSMYTGGGGYLAPPKVFSFVGPSSTLFSETNLPVDGAPVFSLGCVITVQGGCGAARNDIQILTVDGAGKINYTSPTQDWFLNNIKTARIRANILSTGDGIYQNGNVPGGAPVALTAASASRANIQAALGTYGTFGNEGILDTSAIIADKSHYAGLIYAGAASPTIISVRNVGTAGSSTFSYVAKSVTQNGESAPSATFTTPTANATLTAGNYNAIDILLGYGAQSTNIYRTAAPAGYALGLICQTPNNLISGTISTSACDDTGQATLGPLTSNADTSGKIMDKSLADGCVNVASGVFGSTGTPCGSGGGSTPTGTGFTHITSGAQDAAARAVNLASADVTGLLPLTNLSSIASTNLSDSASLVRLTDIQTLTNKTLGAGTAFDDGTGVGGGYSALEGTARAGSASNDAIWADSTSHRFMMNNNNGGAVAIASLSDFASSSAFGVVKVDGTSITSTGGVISAPSIANTTTTVGTTAIAANTCATAVTVTMTGVATTSTFSFTPNADVSGVTGWGTSGGLTIDAWPTANTLNYKVCNQTASSITPSASVTFNVSAK